MVFKLLSGALALLVAIAAAPAGARTLNVAASPVPHAELLEFVRPVLAQRGIALDVRLLSDYLQPNALLQDGHVDANFFQHQSHLDAYNAGHGQALVTVGVVHVEPFGAYSSRLTRIADLRAGAQVALPDDPANLGRALLLLHAQGLVTLRDPDRPEAGLVDIVENPRKLNLRPMPAQALPAALADVDLALINTNYALQSGLNPVEHALFIEGADSPYVNVVATRPALENDEAVSRLVEALNSDETRTFIYERYQGSIVPAF